MKIILYNGLKYSIGLPILVGVTLAGLLGLFIIIVGTYLGMLIGIVAREDYICCEDLKDFLEPFLEIWAPITEEV